MSHYTDDNIQAKTDREGKKILFSPITKVTTADGTSFERGGDYYLVRTPDSWIEKRLGWDANWHCVEFQKSDTHYFDAMFEVKMKQKGSIHQ